MVIQTNHHVAKFLGKTNLVRRMVSWLVELSKFGHQYEPRGSVRGIPLREFNVELPLLEDNPACGCCMSIGRIRKGRSWNRDRRTEWCYV